MTSSRVDVTIPFLLEEKLMEEAAWTQTSIEWSRLEWGRDPRIGKQGFNWGRVWGRLPGGGIGEAGL